MRNKELKFALLLGVVILALIIDRSFVATSDFLLFMMAGLIPAAVIWLTIRVLKTPAPVEPGPFIEDEPDSWYEQ